MRVRITPNIEVIDPTMDELAWIVERYGNLPAAPKSAVDEIRERGQFAPIIPEAPDPRVPM